MNSKDKEYVFRWGRKLKAVRYKGGKCQACNESLEDNIWNAEFHHINPSEKEWNPSEIFQQKEWSVVKNEINKCKLLCKNCHGKLHMNIKRYETLKKDIEKVANDPKAMRTVYARKATKLEKNHAKKLFDKGLTYKEISTILNFQGSTIRGWCPKNHKFDFNKTENEKKIIELYENKKLTMKEICIILRCSFRKLRKKILQMVEEGLIKEYRKQARNQYSKNPNRIMIDGVSYESIKEASLKLKMNYTTVRARIISKSKKWKNYKRI